MTRFLAKFLLFAFCFLFFTISSVSAQESSPSVTPALQINPQGTNAWENFINTLIPNTLKDVNCANLPLEACSGISNKTSSAAKPQAQSGGNQDTVANAAGQYTIASGVHTPSDVSQASTNILDSIINFFKDLAGIFGKGEKEAKNYAGTILPQDVTNQNFAQGAGDLATGNSTNTKVLGAQAGQTAMDKALPIVQCGDLPAGLCTNGKPNSL